MALRLLLDGFVSSEFFRRADEGRPTLFREVLDHHRDGLGGSCHWPQCLGP